MKTIYTNISYTIAALVSVVTISCSEKQEASAVSTTETNTVTVTETQFTSSGMEVNTLTAQPFQQYVATTGSITVPPDNEAVITPYFAGYVKNVSLLPGDEVKKGQVLFTIENPEYLAWQQQFLESKGKLSFLEDDYKRQQLLINDSITSTKAYSKALSAYQVEKAIYNGLKEKLQLLHINTANLSAGNMTAVTTVTAPISGVVTTMEISKGTYIGPQNVAMKVTNLEELHVELNVYEKDITKLKDGQQVIFYAQDNPDKKFEAEVHLVNKAIDPTTRTVNVHADLVQKENAQFLVPGMFLEAKVITNTQTFQALPTDAVVTIDDISYALLEMENETYKKVIVKTGVTNSEFTQILNADKFAPKAKFITKGAYPLISE